MKCPGCGAEIVEGIAKCPFCKTAVNAAQNDKFNNFDFTYTITSKEEINMIREAVNKVSEDSSKTKSDKEKKTPRKPLSKARKTKKRTEKNTNAAKKDKELVKARLKVCSFVLAALVSIAVVVLGVAAVIGAAADRDDAVSVYTYLKDNTEVLVYDGKAVKLTENAISADYIRHASEQDNLPSAQDAAADAKLAVHSKDGKRTYFFENYDPESGSGDLKLIKNGKGKGIQTVSSAVHNSVVLSENGDSLLYLQSADKNGDMGVLYYWKDGMKDPYKIATDIDSGTFAFSADALTAMFLQNLDRHVMQGDFYAKDLKKLKEEKVLVDSAACAVFGTGGKDDKYIYAKGYDPSSQTFDIYACGKEADAEKMRLGEKTKRPPFMINRKNKNKMFVYGAADDDTCNLYYVDIKTGAKERIAAGVNEILKISENGKTVIYDRVYNKKLADYYIYTAGSQPVKVAGNVCVDFDAVGTAPQIAVSGDLSKIVYIDGFDAAKGGGMLYTARIRGTKIKDGKTVAEDVHSCYLAKNGKTVYTKDYITDRKVFDVYVYDGSNSELLKDEVYPEMFGVSQNGNNIFYISGYNITGNYGSLEVSDLKGKRSIIAGDVFEFKLTRNGDLLYSKNQNTENGAFDLFAAYPKKYTETAVDGGIFRILTYQK